MWRTIAVISSGAALGASLRWLLGIKLNATLPTLPLGTLAANLIGGYLIGVAIAYFGNHPGLSPEWRLLIITGFLGGLTTFSTFSAEAVTLLPQGRALDAGVLISVHVSGSLLLWFLGWLSGSAVRGR